MLIKDKTYYHIHRENQFSDLWKVNGRINLTSKQLNNFNQHYLGYYPKMSIDKKEYSVLEAMRIIEQHNLCSNENNSKIVVNQLHSIAQELALYMRESVFEEVRREYFAELPSRKNCIWVCEKESLKYWLQMISSQKPIRIFELRLTGKMHKADQRHLKNEVLPCDIIRENAFNYWSGVDGKNPIEEEILFEGIANVISEFNDINEIL